MINESTSTLSTTNRNNLYKQIFTYISQKAYTPFVYAAPGWTISAHNVHGPGISTSQLSVRWQNV